MSRPAGLNSAARRVIICAAAIVFLTALVRRFQWLGGPYFEFFPPTIQDHVWPARFPSADAIVLCRRVEPLLPRGAKVTVLKPAEAPNYDQTHWMTGLGMLPRQFLVPQKVDELKPDYVIAIHEEFAHADYVKVASFPEGFLYKRR
ncbi:MAG TPA: hypothetical protein VM733_05445 [Thermoanaerobaculia bacterium]|nr:hypothetical protein [Thermoanaerobaculia bacterium]